MTLFLLVFFYRYSIVEQIFYFVKEVYSHKMKFVRISIFNLVVLPNGLRQPPLMGKALTGGKTLILYHRGKCPNSAVGCTHC